MSKTLDTFCSNLEAKTLTNISVLLLDEGGGNLSGTIVVQEGNLVYL